MKSKYIVITQENKEIYFKYFDNYIEAKAYTEIAKYRNNCIRELIFYKKTIRRETIK